MNILAMDTSTQVMGVSILKNNEIRTEIVTNIPKNHSVRLMPAIEQAMNLVGLEPKELDKIVTTIGPGSYTGIRIGLTTAKTMGWALNIPVVGVSSLEVMAYQGRFFEGYICPFIDARRGMVFAGVYQWKQNELHLVYEEKNISMEKVLNKLKEDGMPVLFLSPDMKIHEGQIKEVLAEKAVIPEQPHQLIRPGFIGLAGSKKDPASVHELTPNYLRLAEAEAKWLNRMKEK